MITLLSSHRDARASRRCTPWQIEVEVDPADQAARAEASPAGAAAKVVVPVAAVGVVAASPAAEVVPAAGGGGRSGGGGDR